MLNHAVWDADEVMAQVRGFVVEEFGDQLLQVAAFDESGQEKSGTATAGAQRQYMGCAGRIANGVNFVYCSFATRSGHGLVDGRIYVPKDQLDDPDRRAALGIGEAVVFKTKPELAIDITTSMLAEATMPAWAAADEVYGRCVKFRRHLECNNIGYVVRVGKGFCVELAKQVRLRADQAVIKYLGNRQSWQTRGVPGSKGERRYGWAWLATTSPRHFLLIRRHLATGELAYHYCYIPPDKPISLATLIAVACLRWPVEEDFEFGKDYFGLDQSQVRLYTALQRHIVLTMAALAVCAVTAAQARKHTPPPVLPTNSDEDPPDDTGLIAFTVNEIKRLYLLLNRKVHDITHHLHWSTWSYYTIPFLNSIVYVA